jgi:hypothetical protein
MGSGDLTSEQQTLLQQATRSATEVHAARPYTPVSGEADDPSLQAIAMETLREQSLLLLDSLLAQKEAV